MKKLAVKLLEKMKEAENTGDQALKNLKNDLDKFLDSADTKLDQIKKAGHPRAERLHKEFFSAFVELKAVRRAMERMGIK